MLYYKENEWYFLWVFFCTLHAGTVGKVLGVINWFALKWGSLSLEIDFSSLSLC